MPATFAEQLKRAREAAGLSQAALARRAGLTGSYISVLESRRRPPPSPRVIRSLARALHVDAEPLLEAAAVERSPPSVRKRLERMRRERTRVHRTRDHLLTTTLFHLARRPQVVDPLSAFVDLPAEQRLLLGRLVRRVRDVPTLEDAEARTEDLLEEVPARERDALVRVLPGMLEGGGETSAPPPEAASPATVPVPIHDDLARGGPPREHLHLDVSLWSTDGFLWRVAGDEAHPFVESGDLVLLAPHRPPQDGDWVAYVHEGHARLGLLTRRGGEARLAVPRPDVPPLRLPEADLRPAGVVTWVLRRVR